MPTTHWRDRTVPTSTAVTATTAITLGHRIRPVPSAGSRSIRCPRTGSDVPRTVSTTTITRNGRAVSAPVMSVWSRASCSPTPIRRPPASVRGNDEKPPMRAAARAAMT